MKPFYQDKWVTIFHGDFRRLVLPPADLVIADPPYNETNLTWDKWPAGWVERARSLVKETGSLWCFGSFRLFLERAVEFADWKYSQDTVWEKHNGSNTGAERIRRVHEMMVQFYHGRWEQVYKRPVYTPDAQRRRIHRQKKPAHWNGVGSSVYESEEGGDRLLRSVIYARSCHGHALNETQKPVEIICPLIEHSCPPGGLVVSAFMGSGSDLVAARRLGRRAIGVDVRLEQCQAAVRRLRAELCRSTNHAFPFSA